MKFIISENKLEGLKEKLHLFKVKFLNSFIENSQFSRFDDFIVIFDEDANDFDFDEPILRYDYDEKSLTIDYQIINLFKSMFGDDEEESINFVVKWFEDKFGVKVESLH